MTDWQHWVADFARRHNLLHDPATHALDLVSEVGEVAKEMLRASDYSQRTPQFGPQMAEELGDALYSLLALTEACGVDAGAALNAALKKYERRLAEHGAAASQPTN